MRAHEAWGGVMVGDMVKKLGLGGKRPMACATQVRHAGAMLHRNMHRHCGLVLRDVTTTLDSTCEHGRGKKVVHVIYFHLNLHLVS